MDIFISYSRSADCIVQDIVDYLEPYAQLPRSSGDFNLDIYADSSSRTTQFMSIDLELQKLMNDAVCVIVIFSNRWKETGPKGHGKELLVTSMPPQVSPAFSAMREFSQRLATSLKDRNIWRELTELRGSSFPPEVEAIGRGTNSSNSLAMLAFGSRLSWNRTRLIETFQHRSFGGADPRAWASSDVPISSEACALALLPEGRLAVSGADGTLQLWDLARPSQDPGYLQGGEFNSLQRSNASDLLLKSFVSLQASRLKSIRRSKRRADPLYRYPFGFSSLVGKVPDADATQNTRRRRHLRWTRPHDGRTITQLFNGNTPTTQRRCRDLATEADKLFRNKVQHQRADDPIAYPRAGTIVALFRGPRAKKVISGNSTPLNSNGSTVEGTLPFKLQAFIHPKREVIALEETPISPVLSKPNAPVAANSAGFPARAEGDRHSIDPMLDGRSMLLVWACVSGLLVFVVLQLFRILLQLR